jgi:hypothetical protein
MMCPFQSSTPITEALMNHLRRSLSPALPTAVRLTIIALAIHGGLDLTRGALAQEEQRAYMPHVEQTGSLADRVAELEYLLESFTRDGDTVVVSGANLQVVNGTGTTDGEPNAVGNIIIGYQERRVGGNDRSGSHMLVVGSRHNYSRFGGIVVGKQNATTGEYSSVGGGWYNTASGDLATVGGGNHCVASGLDSSVSGGQQRTASDDYHWAAGSLLEER